MSYTICLPDEDLSQITDPKILQKKGSCLKFAKEEDAVAVLQQIATLKANKKKYSAMTTEEKLEEIGKKLGLD